MKIALVTPYDYPYPGGVTEHVRHLDGALRSLGHDTRILAASSLPEGELAPNVMRVSDAITPVPFNGSTARLAIAPEMVGRVQRLLAAERFDVIHLHEPATPFLNWAVLYAVQAGAGGGPRPAIVGTFHALLSDETVRKHVRPLLAGVSLSLDGRILVSPALERQIGSLLVGPYRVIPNGIDAARFAGAPGGRRSPADRFADGRPNVLFVGRLEPRKGFPVLLKAYPQIKRRVPAARLLVVGAYSEEEKARLADQIRSDGLSDIHLIGRAPAEDLPAYYRAASVFAAPSLGGESFGIVLLEAMAAGAAVVAARNEGYAGVVTDGRDGLLVAPGDEQELAGAVSDLLQDERRRAELVRQGRQTAARYDWGVVAPRIVAYYEEVLRSERKRPVIHLPLDFVDDVSYADVSVPETGGLKVDVKINWKW